MRPVMLMAAAVTVVGIGWVGGTATADPSEKHTLRNEIRSAHEQAKSERESKQAQLRQLKTQIATLRAQAKGLKDPQVRAQLRTQIKGLREQMCHMMEQPAERRVAWAEQDMMFAQQRVELAKAHLAKLCAREGKMERP